jgi:putative ABC transport system permease protein
MTPVTVWIYRTLAALFPRDLRVNFAPEMTQAFADACRSAHERHGTGAVLRVAFRGLADLVSRLLREWLDHLKPSRRPQRRERRNARMLETLGQNLRYAVRSLTKNPGFATIVTLTLALGIGANTAIFSVVHGVLLTPLPYPEPERVITVAEMNPNIDIEPRWVSIPNYVDWKAQTQSFERMALFRGRSRALTGSDDPEYVFSASVTDEFFDVFGVVPFLGRSFRPEETRGTPDRPWWSMSAAPVVILSHGLWERNYTADSSIIGQSISVDGMANTIIGIMPSGFTQPGPWVAPGINVDLWLPFPLDAASAERVSRSFFAAGRLKAGTSLEEARADIAVIGARLRDAYPAVNENWTVTLVPWQEIIVGDVRQALLLVWAVSGVVLLIACANVANLMLNRILSRKGEIVVRAALGASRSRLVRQILTESTMLALLGGLSGVVLAMGGVELVRALNPGNIPMVDQIDVDTTVLGVALATTLVTAMLFGIFPAVIASRPGLATEIKEGTAKSLSKGRHRVRHLMATTQLVLAFTLLVGAGLITRSFAHLTSVSPGLNPDNVFQATVALPWDRVSTVNARADFVQRALERIAGLPGVTATAMINSLPFTGSNQYSPIWAEGQPEPEEGRAHVVAFRGISPTYFETMEISLLQGRPFDRGDVENPTTAIVNRLLVEMYWPDDDPIGKWIKLPGSTVQLTVVGVVDNVKHYGLDKPPQPELYQPYSRDFLTSKTFLLRTANDAAGYGPLAKRAILEVDPDQPVRNMGTMNEMIGASVASPKFNTVMLGLASGVAVVLAIVGLLGVISYVVTERTHEIGIRVALGARPGSVIGSVLRRGAVLAGIGIACGLMLSIASARLLESFLFGISAHDPLTYGAVSAGFIGVTLLASYMPARRASKVDPIIALKQD